MEKTAKDPRDRQHERRSRQGGRLLASRTAGIKRQVPI